MQLYICTYGRSDNQVTWQNLPPSVREFTTLVVQDREKDLYPQYPTLVLPPDITRIGPTRQFLVDYTLRQGQSQVLLMADDDLSFATRRQDEPSKFTPATGQEIQDLLEHMDSVAHLYAHVGVSPRDGANRRTEPALYNTRMTTRLSAYNVRMLQREGIRFDDMECMEDFHVTLSLLELGYKNVVINSMIHDQKGSNTVGGCSHFRTPEVQAAAAYELKRRHPDFVTVVQKKTKHSWGGGVRTDVRVQWKRAYQSARNTDILD